MSTPLDVALTGDQDAALAALAKLPAAQRRKLAPKIITAHRRLHRGDFRPVPDAPRTSRFQYDEGTDEQRLAVRTCLYAVATVSDLTSRKEMPSLNDPATVVAVCRALTPPWLAPDELRAAADAGIIGWQATEALVTAGLCEWPSSDHLVTSLISIGFRSSVPLADVLRGMPAALESGLVYRVFEVEGGQQDSLASADKYRREENRWATALQALAKSGELDRTRLLDGCLAALARDFAPFRAGWFTRFHDQLAPSEDERAARREAYLRLLGSAVPATVSFATKVITKLAKAKRVSAENVLRALPPALQARQKGTVKKAAKLLVWAAKAEPKTATMAIEISIDALAHPDTDVQEALLDTIDGLMPAAENDAERLREVLASQRDLVAPSLQTRLPAGGDGADDVALEPAPLGEQPSADPFDDSYAVPLARDLEHALELVARALEHPADAMAQEQALDAIARHAAPAGDWQKLGGPLRKRASTLRKSGPWEIPTRFALAWLVSVWTERSEPAYDLWEHNDRKSFRELEFYVERVRKLAGRVLAGQSLPLLSTPTHQGGHLARSKFDEACAAWRQAGIAFEPYDAVLACMRLGPTQGREVRQALRGVRKELLTAATAAASHEVRIVRNTSNHHTWFTMETTPEPAVPEPAHCLYLRHLLLRGTTWLPSYVSGWCATAFPHDLGAHFAQGIRRLGGFEMDEAGRGARELLPAREAWVELGEQGHWLLAIALAARGAPAIEVGLDVAIDGISQGRVDTTKLGRILGQLMPSGLLKAKRLATTLSQVAETSSLHAEAVRTIIAGGLRGDPADAPRDVSALLSLLHELSVAAQAKLADPDARQWLEDQKRGGKVRTLRKKILALG